MTTIQEIINGSLISNNVVIDGVSGNGFITMGSQSTVPATPSSGYNLYASATSDLTIIKQDGFSRTINMPTTADVTYTLPDTGDSDFVMTAGDQLIDGNKTFSENITTQKSLALPATSTTAGQIIIDGTSFLHRAGASTNVFVGSSAGNFVLTGSANVVVGAGSMTSASTASDNTVIGQDAASALLTGTNNIIIGQAAGSAIVGTSSNILIGSPGVLGDDNTIRIGTSQTAAHIAGVANTSSDSGSQLVFVNPTTSRLWANSTASFQQQYTVLGTISTTTGSINSWLATGTYEVTAATNVPCWIIITGGIVVITLPAFAFTCSSNSNSTIRYTIVSGGTFPFTVGTSNIKWWSIPVISSNTQNGVISLISSTVWEITRNPASNFSSTAQGITRRIAITYNTSR